MVDDSAEMDRKFFSRIIREMRDCGVEELGLFFIGESFLCRWLPDAIREAKSIGFPYVFLTTNGSAAKPDKVKACFEAGLDSLKFSLNFPDEGQFEEIAQVSPVYFRKAVEHLKEARRIRDDGNYRCGIYASSIDFDGEQGERMRALVEEVRPFVDEHYWLPLFSMGGASENSGMKPIVGNPGRLAAPREPLPCWSVTTAHIDRHGKLIACCFGAAETRAWRWRI